MSSLLCFIQVILCSSCHNIFLMTQVVLQHLKKIHNLRLIINERQHDHTKCILKLCMFI